MTDDNYARHHGDDGSDGVSGGLLAARSHNDRGAQVPGGGQLPVCDIPDTFVNFGTPSIIQAYAPKKCVNLAKMGQNFAFSVLKSTSTWETTLPPVVMEVTNISNELVIIVAFTFLVMLPGINPDYCFDDTALRVRRRI